MLQKTGVLAAVAAAVWWSASAHGQATSCSGPISRDNVVRCALSASALVRAEQAGVDALRARERTAHAVLPSNPTLALSGAQRASNQLDTTNWYATLSQEVEIAGQRRARKRATEHERSAQQSAVQATERDVAAAALRAYFEVLAARDSLRLTEHMEQTFASATVAARVAAERGAVAGIEADVAEVSGVRLAQARIAAERRHLSALAALSTLLGVDPSGRTLEVEGELVFDLTPERSVPALAARAVAERPELASARATGAAHEAWAQAHKRSRVPNLTFSLLAQRDGFDERVLGGGVSLPITLPAPLGRDYSGQAGESAALSRRSRALAEQLERHMRLELVTAEQALAAAEAEQALFTEERVARAEQTLASIAREVAAGRLAISAVIVPQEALIDFLHKHVQVRLARCLAALEVLYAAGQPLTGKSL